MQQNGVCLHGTNLMSFMFLAESCYNFFFISGAFSFPAQYPCTTNNDLYYIYAFMVCSNMQ